ncbi:ATP synthase subunit I [Haliea sp. E1-2-M8]|uniref:ATP synthase subunit I n=1 Tax=Haliea sp. E1-2-M8 TaxID=3064706 RepID=UPI0027244683|nr:ATP synthase subunit I [Haliea sp. E1-2-M8]MDO8860113.1 ATP synthase subunit I [Haliea sp. E1-2-M8]
MPCVAVEPARYYSYNARAQNEELSRGKWCGVRPVVRRNVSAYPVPPVHRVTLAQLATLVPLCLLVWLALDQTVALSVLCGGVVAVAPQVWFADRLFRSRGARSAPELARSALGGAIGKFLLSVAGFAAVFALLRPVAPVAVFAGYVAMLAVQMTGSWLLLKL